MCRVFGRPPLARAYGRHRRQHQPRRLRHGRDVVAGLCQEEMRIGFRDEDIAELFKTIDKDAGGSIDTQEFIKTLYPDEFRLMYGKRPGRPTTMLSSDLAGRPLSSDLAGLQLDLGAAPQ
mmetsp:Transcript_110573/g.352272  ORF Transcript_110573/g.352272 Transcript_110573/m.352272 type:complete len:120 (-) Transcript_110573:4-363(-)